ncbi:MULTISPECIES: arabinofuranosidase catalytic domain-containing protein [unclassified Streptomyces]|uniref:arabinofuranosidase catalytic domain-containing protein n=1 Tax=unclassified Streptomyces TaxID=2593676 RepID=UPI0022509A7D|nr:MULTISPECIES: arabinofuranosidase catalytic domain-containing protein [unclassified Streptomyces]MCX5052448.1 ricin-type beta-trefoil lectin domain protein [Streptomyces sp. NBC_00474]MCX5064232.1 ricin-type beta-trefoil lectin domain protein [Streptomyces sp. NBC_00452]MCX5251613.1 ricin-type beta-trefoil lectin domain protein [Streptomyces sp. NBC_00201]MCX5294462.1 ricin-type beta-trefoil lectin domain protein [Streptomyces sp. NBC_00183]
MALLAMFLTAAPAWSAPTSAAALVSSASGRCLDVKGNVDTSGTGMQIWDCNGQANQAFEFTAAGELRTMNGTRCVDAYDTRTAPGAAVVIRPCDGRVTQMWRQNPDSTVTGAASGFCLDVSGAGTADGTAVILWTCNGQSNQKWTAPAPPADGSGPCDIYAAGATPCVAAHSTVRALYGSYNGPLYQVRRASDNATKDIGVLASGGFADAAAQDSFCAGTACVITVVRDQSGHGNDLWYQGSAQVPGSSQSSPAKATSESLTAGGTKAYSLYINPGNSYWRDGHLTGVPTGAAPEGAYMVTSGTHVNGGCCFDYGNSETDRKADAAGAMDAINFGTQCWFGGCSGSGPWVQADLEWGLYSGGSQSWNPGQRAFANKFVTAMLKNNGTSRFALKGGNAQSGGLTTLWDGGLPSGYSPMKKQGAIVLGSGGDCCKPGGGANLSAGTFYEGAVVAGYPSDATDSAVQADITAAGYR